MSVVSELERIAAAKSALAVAIEGKGVEVPAGSTLDVYAALVESISTGFGAMLGGEGIGGTTPDATAASSAVVVAELDGADSEICSASVELPFGCWSVVVRAKASATGEGTLMRASAYHAGDLLASVDVPHGLFDEAGRWESVAFGVDFHGDASDGRTLRVELTSPDGGAAGVDVSVDYIWVLPAATALGSVG